MEKEPTIGEVMGVVKDLAVSVQDLTEAVQTGFAKVETRLDRHEKLLTALHEGQENLREIVNERTNALDKRVSDTQNRVEDVVDMLGKEVPNFNLARPTLRNN